MNKRLNSAIAYLIIVICFLLAGGSIISKMVQVDDFKTGSTLTHGNQMEKILFLTDGWLTYQDQNNGYKFKYPADWKSFEDESIFLNRGKEILRLNLEKITSEKTPAEYAENLIKKDDCSRGKEVAQIAKLIKKNSKGAYFSTFCPEKIETYNYSTKLNNSRWLTIAYKNNFTAGQTMPEKIEILQTIVATLIKY